MVVPTAGPYWQARGRALAARPDVQARLIAVADTERTYPWETEQAGSAQWRVLAQGVYERLGRGEIARALLAELEAFAPDALYTVGYSDAVMRQAARWAKRRSVVSLAAWVGNRDDRRRRWWTEALKRGLITGLYDGVFAAGERSRQYALESGVPQNCIAVGQAVVDNEFFAAGAARARADCAAHRAQRGLAHEFFLYVGRFAPEKNLGRLLEAHQHYGAAASGEPWDLVLIGDGADKGALQQLAARSDPDAVRFHPWMPPGELAGWYGLASCLILPSLREPWGAVVNEAMAAGLPVLVSERCGCAPELVREGENGFTFDPLDVGELAERMSRVAEVEPERRQAMGRTSQEIIAQFTPETWAAALVNLVRTVSGEMKGPEGRP